MTEQEIDLLILDRMRKITHKQRAILTQDYKKSLSLQENCDFLIKELSDGVYNEIRENIQNAKLRQQVVAELQECGVTPLFFNGEGYPKRLLQLKHPPIVLYAKGNLRRLNEQCITVVGSRHTTPNMRKLGEKVVSELCPTLTVVSGVATGGDQSAMTGANESGKLIVVLPCGHCGFSTTSELAGLLNGLSKEALVLSEYPPKVVAMPFSFPLRNRLLAGLGESCLVISAGEKSGALITAEYATQLHKKVMAFPYGIGVPSGEGCNDLIKKGAQLVENSLDISRVLGISLQKQTPLPLSEEEEVVYALLKEGIEHIQMLAQSSGYSIAKLNMILMKLQIKRLAVSLGANRYGVV